MVEIEKLSEQAGTVDNPEDAADLIKKYEEILKQKGKALSLSPVIKAKCLVGFKRRKSL